MSYTLELETAFDVTRQREREEEKKRSKSFYFIYVKVSEKVGPLFFSR